jgi:hypothetical protein
LKPKPTIFVFKGKLVFCFVAATFAANAFAENPWVLATPCALQRKHYGICDEDTKSDSPSDEE